MTGGCMTVLTGCFARAVDYARIACAGQKCKSPNVSALRRPCGVASLLIEYDGTEDQ